MDKDSISSQGAHARPYLGHSHSISMLEYAQINMSQCGDGTNWWHLKIYSIVHMCPVIQSLSHPHHFLFFFLMSFRYGRSTHGNGQGLRKPRSRIGKTSHVMPKAAILWGHHPLSLWNFDFIIWLRSCILLLVPWCEQELGLMKELGGSLVWQCLPFPAAGEVIRFVTWEDQTMKNIYDSLKWIARSLGVFGSQQHNAGACSILIHQHLKNDKIERWRKVLALPSPSFTDITISKFFVAALFSSKWGDRGGEQAPESLESRNWNWNPLLSATAKKNHWSTILQCIRSTPFVLHYHKG